MQVSLVKVRVLVIYANENSPVLETEGDDEIYFSEHEPVGMYITEVTAQDKKQQE